VAIGGDDFLVGVKSQSNSEIAGFLRNLLRWSAAIFLCGGDRALNGSPSLDISRMDLAPHIGPGLFETLRSVGWPKA